MLNDVILVGRLAREIVLYETETGKKLGSITLAVPRSFRNMDGLYETDFIPCILWEEKAKLARDYCHTGDIIGIKGRLQSRMIDTKEGKIKKIEVVADRITFLANSNNKKNDVKKNDKESLLSLEETQ